MAKTRNYRTEPADEKMLMRPDMVPPCYRLNRGDGTLHFPTEIPPGRILLADNSFLPIHAPRYIIKSKG